MPEIHYARSGDVAIAYQVIGEGPIDLVFVPTFANLVFPWFNRDWKSFYDRLVLFARLILLDKRGTGLGTAHATLEASRRVWTTSVRFSTQPEPNVPARRERRRWSTVCDVRSDLSGTHAGARPREHASAGREGGGLPVRTRTGRLARAAPRDPSALGRA